VKLKLFLLLFLVTSGHFIIAQPVRLNEYNIVWNSPSRNSSESMPCGGGDIGLNVWVENGDVLFYIAKSGFFDENNGLMKAGRIRLRLSPNPFDGGMMLGENMIQSGNYEGKYLDTEYKGWLLKSKLAAQKQSLEIILIGAQTESLNIWKERLQSLTADCRNTRKTAFTGTQEWWRKYWNHSFVMIGNHKDSTSWNVGRNYQLFRYMLACNASGEYPTKFNGGLFTVDPVFTDTARNFTPDFRNWGGGTFTAQNQRLVYFPMLKSGDFELMKPQFDFYLRILRNAELRSEVYWQHNWACFTEQMENFGLPNCSEYGWERPVDFDKGLEYNPWLEYEWDTSLEFCLMMLETERYTGKDIAAYIPFIESCLTFFDEHYQYLAKQRGIKKLDAEGHLVLYPGSACETFKMTTNSTSTIAPAKSWERINNVEVPQLYPVFPWGLYGFGKPDLELALNTWKHDQDAIKNRSHVGWKQDNIFAARLGMTDEAVRLNFLKLQDSGRRFPAFWGPGFDWVPDHNWGGAGMIGIQEMLLQVDGDKIHIFPAWPKNIDVYFKLHAPWNTTIEGSLKDGKIEFLNVLPEERRKDIVSIFQE
jgi:hypothetical protein